MSILHTMSDAEKTKYKADKLKEIRDFNAEVITDLGISPFDFNMKSQFYDEQGRLVVGIFPSEFKKPNGFYFELINSDLNPIDPERKIYRVAPSDSYEEEYALNSRGSYLVPIEELKIVNRSSVAISKMSAVTGTDDIFQPGLKKPQTVVNKTQLFSQPEVRKAPALMEDAPFSEMTIRDYYAIHSGKPVSARQWLNNLIKDTTK